MRGYSRTTVYQRKEDNKQSHVEIKVLDVSRSSLKLKTATLTTPLLLTPIMVSADAFTDIHRTVMGIFDAGVVLVIIFAGASWGLGHRSKAIELLIGACCGYLLARHAIDIRDYLKNIG